MDQAEGIRPAPETRWAKVTANEAEKSMVLQKELDEEIPPFGYGSKPLPYPGEHLKNL